MSDDLVELLTSPQFILAVLVSVSVFATLFTLLTPLLGGNELKTRMKSVATERDEIRARERARLAAEKQQSRGSLRMEAKEGGVRRIVERLDLKTALADQATIDKLRAAGFRPGEDVFVSGADGTTGGAEMIKQGRLLCTSANVPQFMGGLLTTRLYDVMHGWAPTAPERMMSWRSVTMTADNVDGYLERYVDGGDVPPFDYARMSKVLHPEDWDPQAELFPMDIDLEWGGIDKPDGWEYPAAYVEARENGEAERIRQLYADHYKIDLFGPSPMKG